MIQPGPSSRYNSEYHASHIEYREDEAGVGISILND